LVVFGRAAGLHFAEALKQGVDEPILSEDDIEIAASRLTRWEKNDGGESADGIRKEMQAVMQNDFGVFRTGQYMKEGLEKLKGLRARLEHAVLPDKSRIFNTSRIEALELDNLMAVAIATAFSAEQRDESRGAHSREDFPERNDAKWLKHTLYFPGDVIKHRAVNMTPKTSGCISSQRA